MTTETGSPAGGEAIFATELPADAPETFNSPNEAASYFTALKEKKSEPAESADTATADKELPDEGNADPETAPREDADEAEPAEVPLIDPPRSWTQAEKERFQSLPRETQEYLSHREQERETALRRSQNEVADKLKGLTAKEQEAENARQQYEAKLPALMQALHDVQADTFSDIKTMDDVKRMAAEDPFRKIQWDTQQQVLQAVQWEAQQAEQRTAQEKQSKRANYETEQNKLLIDLVPEMADPKKASELRERAVAMLTDDLGLKNDQLSRWMQDDTGHEILSTAGIQKLIADGLKYRDILKAPKAVAKPNLPPVQRPGTSRPSGQGVDSERIQALNRKPELTVKEATELYELQQRSTRRAS